MGEAEGIGDTDMVGEAEVVAVERGELLIVELDIDDGLVRELVVALTEADGAAVGDGRCFVSAITSAAASVRA